MKRKQRIISSKEYDEKLYELAKSVLPVLYEKVDLKYMEKDNIFHHTSFTAISFAEAFLEEIGFVTQGEQKSPPPSPLDQERKKGPIISLDSDSNMTKIDLTKLKKIK